MIGRALLKFGSLEGLGLSVPLVPRVRPSALQLRLEVRADGFGPEGVGFGSGVEKVGHGFAREGAIWFEQLAGDVEQGGFCGGGDGGEQGVDGGHLEACVPAWASWCLATG